MNHARPAKRRPPVYDNGGRPRLPRFTADEVRARRIVLEDDAGKAAAVLACGPGGPAVALFDGSGAEGGRADLGERRAKVYRVRPERGALGGG